MNSNVLRGLLIFLLDYTPDPERALSFLTLDFDQRPLGDDLLLTLDERSGHSQLHERVRDRQAVLVEEQVQASQDFALLHALEETQLRVWEAYYTIEGLAKEEEASEEIAQEIGRAVVQSLFSLQRRLTRGQLEQPWSIFLSQELAKIVDDPSTLDRRLLVQENLCDLLTSIDTKEVSTEKWQTFTHALASYSSYFLTQQLLSYLVDGLKEFSEIYHELIQNPSYSTERLDHADHLIKRLCRDLKVSGRHPGLLPDLLEQVGQHIVQGWQELRRYYQRHFDHKGFLDGQMPFVISARLLQLGLVLGGICDPEPPYQLQPGVGVEEVTSQTQAWMILDTLLSIIESAVYSDNPLKAEDIERLKQHLAYTELEQSFLSDLHFLYHRDPRAGPREVVRLVTFLLPLSPLSTTTAILDACKRTLTHALNLWSGSCFPSFIY